MRKPVKNAAKTALFLLLALSLLTPLGGREIKNAAQRYVKESVAAVLQWIA